MKSRPETQKFEIITSPSRQNSDIPPSSRAVILRAEATIRDSYLLVQCSGPVSSHRSCHCSRLMVTSLLAAASASSTPASSQRPPSASNLRKDRRTVLRRLLLRDWSNSSQGVTSTTEKLSCHARS